MARTYRLVETHIVLVPWKLSAKPPVFFDGALHPNGAGPKTPDMFWDLEPGT